MKTLKFPFEIKQVFDNDLLDGYAAESGSWFLFNGEMEICVVAPPNTSYNEALEYAIECSDDAQIKIAIYCDQISSVIEPSQSH